MPVTAASAERRTNTRPASCSKPRSVAGAASASRLQSTSPAFGSSTSPSRPCGHAGASAGPGPRRGPERPEEDDGQRRKDGSGKAGLRAGAERRRRAIGPHGPARAVRPAEPTRRLPEVEDKARCQNCARDEREQGSGFDHVHVQCPTTRGPRPRFGIDTSGFSLT